MTPALIADLKAALAPEMEPERVIVPRAEVRKEDLSELERRRYAGFARKALHAEAARLATQPKPGAITSCSGQAATLGNGQSTASCPRKP